ncbi:carboxypeptidase-like regulatory domain-containing protein [Aquimarina sp. I32.4]|uniref:carboxypeptidase-like regulatory domain-containing protein n=1 Tax=Aquimarina sp. I32.4 TaxID=2053903 RepID=UPI000CDE8639|nr:carboxypeptidase-like regulatory domain-containing protein [Aquimarina sp. I32.4]
MRKAIVIDIPKPCHEDWGKMTSEEKGKHCKVCAKTVYDFTAKTDEQIIKKFEGNNNICGRFKNSQLGRELAYSRKEKNNYRSYIASGIFSFLVLGTNETNAQEEPIKQAQIDVVSDYPTHVKGKVATSILNERTVSGTIVDEQGFPLPGVLISIKGKGIVVQSDFDGVFALKATKNDVLQISYIGYKILEIQVSDKSEYDITLVEDHEELMGDIVIHPVSGIDQPYPYTPEELEEKRKREFRRENNKKFYIRKYKEQQEAKRVRRIQIRNGEIERTRLGQIMYDITHVFQKK